MKRLILFLFLSLSLFSVKAQEVFAVDSVVSVPNKSADEIYSAISKWLATNIDIQSAQAIVSYNDEKRSATTKAVIEFEVKNLTWHSISGVLYCTIDVSARDGRYRIRFADFVHDSSTPDQLIGKWDEGLLYEDIPAERNKGIGGKLHREIYKRAKKRIAEWTDEQISSLTNYINSFKNLDEEDW